MQVMSLALYGSHSMHRAVRSFALNFGAGFAAPDNYTLRLSAEQKQRRIAAVQTSPCWWTKGFAERGILRLQLVQISVLLLRPAAKCDSGIWEKDSCELDRDLTAEKPLSMR